MDSDCLSLLQELQGSAPGGKFLDFDSPMGGDDDDIVAPIVTGSELVLVNDASRLCLGKIGETKVCLCLLEECGVRSHQRNKVPATSFPGDRCLLVGSGLGSTRGFLAPVLDATNLSETLIHSLLGRVDEDWGKTFELVAVEQIEDLDAEGNVLELTKSVKRKLLSTPNPKRINQTDGFEHNLDKVKRARKILMEGPSAAYLRQELDTVRELGKSPPKEALKSYYDGIDSRIDLTVGYCHGMETLIEMLQHSLAHEMLSMDEAISGTKAIVTMIEGDVGKRTKALEGCHPTVWGSIAELCATTTQHQTMIESALRTLVMFKKDQQSRSRGRSVNFSPPSERTDASTAPSSQPTDGGLSAEPFFDRSGIGQARGGAFGARTNPNATIMGGVLKANRYGVPQSSVAWDGSSKGGMSSLGGHTSTSGGSSSFSGFSGGFGDPSGGPSKDPGGGFGGGPGGGSMGGSSGNGSGYPGGGLGGGGGGGSDPGSGTGATSPSPSVNWDGGRGGFGDGFNSRETWESFQEAVTSDLRAGREMMDKLAVRVDKLESAPEGEDTVVLGGHTLRCKKDVQALLETHLGVNCDVPAGAFASPQFLLNEVMLTLGCTMPTLDDLSKLKRLDVRAIDLRCTQALMATLPVFITSGRLSTYAYKGSSGGSGRFKAFPSFVDWGIKSDEDKLQYKCFRALEEVCNALEDHIRDTLGNSAQMQLIAMNLLSKCKKVVIEIFDFMADNYTRMMAAFDSSADAWDLGCFGIQQLFLNDFSVPLSCMKFADFSNARNTLVTAVWTNLRIGAIVDKFNETGIQNHPAMSAAQVRFIIQQAKATRSSKVSSEVESLKDQVKALQDTVKRLESTVNQHTGKISQVESRADKACSALDIPADGKKRNKKKKEEEKE